MVDFVEVSLGKGRPAACRRCGDGGESHYRPAFEVVAEIEAACAAWGAGPGPNIALTGPEPFGHPDPVGLVTAAARAGAQRVRIDTDGEALGRPGVSAEMLGAGVRHVRVSLAGDSEGARGPSLAGMRAFAAEAESSGVRVAVSAHVRVCRHNLEQLPVTVAAAAEAGASHVLLELADGRMDVRAAMPWIAAACDSGTVNSTWVEVAGVPYCLAGALALHLVPLFRPVPPPPGAKTDACRACAVDDVCSGLPAEAAPTIVAAIAPCSVEKALAESIRRAFVEPGPGEGE